MFENVTPLSGSCVRNGVATPAATTVHPFYQSPPAAETVTLTLRLIASLRANIIAA